MAPYKETSVAAIFQNQVIKYGEKACVSFKKDGVYSDISWNEMNSSIRNLGLYLISSGIRKGDKVAIFSPNRYEWWVADQAILSVGAVNVPIYVTSSSEEAHYILEHSESKICFVGEEEHLLKVLKIKRKLPRLKTIIMFDTSSKKSVVSFGEAIRKGAAYRNKALFDKKLSAIKPKDIATIIYTSGTTGDPKGVMLTHHNFVSNLKQLNRDFGEYFSDEEVYLSILPLSHSFERNVGYYLPISMGAKVAFSEDFSTIQQNLLEIKPTMLVCVPRLYEKIHAGILAQIADASSIRKIVFNWAMKTAVKNLSYICNDRTRKWFFAKRYKLADKLVFSKIKTVIGLDRIKFQMSGGGPLSIADAEFFLGMDILVLEGYGLTETSPVTNANRPGMIKPGSVGPSLSDTIVKISDEGEVLIKGPQVMTGYYKNKKASKEAFTKDGFLKTGDLGMIDDMGRLSITGRIKEIIVTSGGKNISPQNIENSLKASNLIEQVAVIGDRRKYLSALIIPAFEELHKWSRENDVPFSDNWDLISNEKVIELYEQEIEINTRRFSRIEQVRKFKLLNTEWTQETGELTPTLKLKRRIIEKKYAEDIDSMYPPE
jgi:long-chain acyl-CoA synthetase